MKINFVSLKEINKKNILKIIIKNGPISRIRISELLNISRPTISSYVNELIGGDMIKEIGKDDSTPAGGKKAILLKFNSKAGYIIGAMIDVDIIKIVITDITSNIIKRINMPTEEKRGPKAVIDKTMRGIHKIIEDSGIDKKNILGIGIGATGLVDSNEGLVIFSPNLEGWNNIKLEEIVEKNIGIPTFIENECRVRAVAEKIYGLARNVRNFVCINSGIGISSGIFINNKLLVGNKGMAGEIGHIITKVGGDKICHCGNVGCLETLCSVRTLMEDIKKDVNSGRKSNVNLTSELEIEDLWKLYKEGDYVVINNVEENARYLGIGISNVIKMFNPELVIIHGVSCGFGKKYLEIVKKAVAENTFPKVKDNYNIKFSLLGEDADLIGATSIIFQNIFNLDSFNVAGEYIIKRV